MYSCIVGATMLINLLQTKNTHTITIATTANNNNKSASASASAGASTSTHQYIQEAPRGSQTLPEAPRRSLNAVSAPEVLGKEVQGGSQCVAAGTSQFRPKQVRCRRYFTILADARKPYNYRCLQRNCQVHHVERSVLMIMPLPDNLGIFVDRTLTHWAV